jgi:hypothetical protein
MLKRTFLPTTLAALTLAFAVACSPPTDGDVPGVEAAKGGPSGGGPSPTVDATDPSEGEQGTTLDVRVLGTNYDQGSSVDFLLDGKPTQKVKTNSSSFVSSTEVVANITIADDALVAGYDVRVTASNGKKGVGIEKFQISQKVQPGTFPVTDVLPAYSVSDGLFGDGQTYLETMDTQGTTSLTAQCSENRKMVLRLPASWADEVVSGTPTYCDTKLDLNQLTACPDGTSCPLGTNGHDVTTHYALDVNYYFYVTSPKPKGRGTIQTEYDVVWIDVTYSVTGWAGGVANGTACAWHVVGSTAEFWTGNPTDESKVGENAPMELDVTVTRTDATCSP